MQIFQHALALKEETIAHRRYFHQNAETGTEMPLARHYILHELQMLGIEAQSCGGGIVAEIGNGAHTILLRADMDALPMPEESGLPFACPTGKAAHTCGHDLHAAMLLTAAKLLKAGESDLCGRVRLMFQPAEELLCGAKKMLACGLLRDPKPEAALAVHVGPSGNVGECWYNAESTMMLSCDAFSITVQGRGGHSAYPHRCTDPIGAAVQICNALGHLVQHESDPAHNTVLTIGSIHAGTAYNIIPETAVLEGSLRTEHPEERARLMERIRETAVQTAGAYRCRVRLSMLAENPPLLCDRRFTEDAVRLAGELPDAVFHSGIRSSGSDDFAEITARIPSAYLFLAAGFPDAPSHPSHHPAVRFNEDVLSFGAALLAHCATGWLRSQTKSEHLKSGL
ncbi:MAG: amidohydrolase [Oscillospiraceae bacterium]|nr:amidohydrolase [Oscillospiraceae bacterium]